MKRLLEYVSGLADTELQGLAIQDIALCQAWLVNDGPTADGFDFRDTLSRQVTYWLAHAQPQTLESEGRRHQTVLRELLERAEQPDKTELARDELDFLETVHALASAAHQSEAFERVRRIIQKCRVRLSARRSRLPEVKGLPTITKRLMVVTTEDIASAPAQDVRYVAGIELPSRGPVLKHAGHLRVLGDVPENATLVVEEADVVVDGFVMGRIAASGSCEILNNISGVVIAGRGDVRARNLVEGAYVIAKRGAIRCRASRGAKLAFSGSTVHILDSASRSRILAPRIQVGGRVNGGELHTSETAIADLFAAEDNAALNIVFRRRLSCQDYGEYPGRGMAVDLSNVYRLRRKCEQASQRMQMAALSAEQAAEGALAHIILGDAASRLAKDLVSAQRRLEVIHRVLLGMRATYGAAEDRMTEVAAPNDSGDPSTDLDENQRLLQDIGAEIDSILEDLPEERDTFRARREELEAAHKILKEAGSNRVRVQTMLHETAAKLASLQEECDELRSSIRRNQRELQAAMAKVHGLGIELGGATRVLTLQKLIATLREVPADNPMRKRLATSYVVMLLKTVQKRLGEMKTLKASLDELTAEFRSCRQKIWDQYQTHVADPDTEALSPYVEGRFEGPVRLLAEDMYLTEDHSKLPAGGVLTVSPNDEGPRRFVCSSNKIHEEALTAKEPPDDSPVSSRELSTPA